MRIILTTCLTIYLTLSASALASIVANDDLGNLKKSEHLVSGSNYTWEKHVPASVKDRNVAFGNTVALSYGKADSTADYKLKAVLSADATPREVRISIDGITLAKKVIIPSNSEKTVTLKIPNATYADGKFTLTFHKGEASPNIAVSSVQIFSSITTPLAVPPIYDGLAAIQYTPIPVENQWSQSLNGIWKFTPKAPADFSKITSQADWKDLEVPGQWRNQGYDLPKEQATGYQRSFSIPSQWKNRQIKLRFDAVFSDCEVFVNGRSVGTHTGGMTPFELDITKAIQSGNNSLSLRVTSWSLADQMASASKYACHTLGGISRDVTLFSVPNSHLKDVYIQTDFDDSFKDATLKLALDLSQNAEVSVTLFDGGNKKIITKKQSLKAGANTLSLPIQSPKHWTPETPYLYTLEISVNGSVTRHPVGFREIEVTQSQILVNGNPVMLRGINRHEADPLRGRSLAKGQWEKDILLFRDANCNLIRTCHYPPALHLGTAADKHGMWIEMEGPFCWENGPNNPKHHDLTVKQLAEMVKAWRNHPSVLYWSLANESSWGRNFINAAKVMRELDPSRALTFNWMSQYLNKADQDVCEIGNIHYPGFRGTAAAKNCPERPLLFGEYAHLNAYNRRELITDPGLRDRWGSPLAEMWETMWQSPSISGGAIWSGIDDTFFLGDNLTVGYGAWGPVDPWRRPKPEHWHMKKVYSPIHLLNRHTPQISQTALTLKVENRGDFLNFNELNFTWKHGAQSGNIKPNIDVRKSGELTITPPKGIKPGTDITLTVTHPLGYVIDRFVFPTKEYSIPSVKIPAPQLTKTKSHFTITQGKSEYQINRSNGIFTANVTGGGKGNPVITYAPHLILTPLNSEGNTQMTGETKTFQPFSRIAQGWKNEAPTATTNNGIITITVPCAYTEAKGSYIYTFTTGKPVRLDYNFTMKTKINPRQTGIAFDMAKGFDQLSWKRTGQWTAYPSDHIGRLTGTAQLHYKQGVDAIEIGPRTRPTLPWSQDNTLYGSNDFRATKNNIRRAELKSATATLNIFAEKEGTHFQSILKDGTVQASVLGYSNEGSERFLRRLVNKNDRPLKSGDKLTGTIYFNVR